MAARPSARSATTASRTGWSRPAPRRARRRVATLHERGVDHAYLYGADEELAGGLGAFFLLTEAPERYGLPANADSPIQEGAAAATLAAVAAGLTAAAGVAAGFVLWRRQENALARAPPASPFLGGPW